MPPALRISGAATLLLLASAACADPAPKLSAPTPEAEAERDRLLSQCLQEEAQIQFDRGNLPDALAAYQRAWRWDQDNAELLDKVVWLSAELGRLDVAVRYAALQPHQPAGSEALTRRLALHAAQGEDWQAAATLLGRWLASPGSRESELVRALALIEHGRVEFLLGNSQVASASFAEVQRMLLDTSSAREARRISSALGGDVARLMETFGNCHLEAGHLGLAREAFEQLADAGDRRAAAQYWLARLSLAEARALDAYLLLQEYFSEPGDPLEMLPYELLQQTLVQLNDEDRLARDLQQIAAGREDSPFLALAKARFADKQGEASEARSLYRRVVDGVGSDTAQRIDEEQFAEAGGWLILDTARRNAPNRLLPLLSQLVQTDPGLSLFDEALADVVKDPSFRRQIEARLENPTTQTSLDPTESVAAARLSVFAERYDLALRHIDNASAALPDRAGALQLSLAVDLLLAEAYPQARELLERSLQSGAIGEENSAAWYYLSTAQEMEGQTDKALESAKRAVELEPDSPDLALRAAWVLQHAEQTDQAIAANQEFLKGVQEDSSPAARDAARDAQIALSYLWLEKQGQTEAEEALLHVLDEFPADARVLNDLGYMWASRGRRLYRALRMTRQAVDLQPDNAAYLDSLGWALHRVGRFDEALDTLQQAIALSEAPDAEVLDHLAQTHRELGQWAPARDAWRQAQALLERDATKPQLRARIRTKLATLPKPTTETSRPGEDEQPNN